MKEYTSSFTLYNIFIFALENRGSVIECIKKTWQPIKKNDEKEGIEVGEIKVGEVLTAEQASREQSSRILHQSFRNSVSDQSSVSEEVAVNGVFSTLIFVILGNTGRLKSFRFFYFPIKKVVVIKSNKMEVLPNPIVYANEYEGKNSFSDNDIIIDKLLKYKINITYLLASDLIYFTFHS